MRREMEMSHDSHSYFWRSIYVVLVQCACTWMRAIARVHPQSIPPEKMNKSSNELYFTNWAFSRLSSYVSNMNFAFITLLLYNVIIPIVNSLATNSFRHWWIGYDIKWWFAIKPLCSDMWRARIRQDNPLYAIPMVWRKATEGAWLVCVSWRGCASAPRRDERFWVENWRAGESRKACDCWCLSD